MKQLSRGWKLFSIITIVFSILNLVFACLPDIGTYAILSGGLALILSCIILIKAIRTKTKKRIAIISLIISIASIGMGYWTFLQAAFNFVIQPGWDDILIKH